MDNATHADSSTAHQQEGPTPRAAVPEARSPEILLEVRHLVKDFGRFRAVDDISFVVPKGKIVGLLGPNGAGKTTTIHMLLGITTPTITTRVAISVAMSHALLAQIAMPRCNKESAR